MAKLIPIQYGSKKYPNGINPQIVEVAAHFDKEKIKSPKDRV